MANLIDAAAAFHHCFDEIHFFANAQIVHHFFHKIQQFANQIFAGTSSCFPKSISLPSNLQCWRAIYFRESVSGDRAEAQILLLRRYNLATIA